MKGTLRLLAGVLAVTALAGALLAGGAGRAAAEAAPSRDATLVIGMVSDNPKKHYARLKPVVDYVAARMADLGIERGEVLLAKDNGQMVRYLRQGKVDWVSETPFSAVHFRDRARARVLLRRWKKGVAEYHTVFFARVDSGIDSLDDLVGRVVAFEDPGSTSAYYVPSAVLLRDGLELVQLDSPRDHAIPGRVGFVFSGEEINTATWVHKGLVDAGAFSNLDWDKADRMPAEFRRDLRVFHVTASFPRALELVRHDLDERITARLREVLVAAAGDADGRAVLSAYQGTARFDAITPEVLAGLDEARELLDVVRSELAD